MKTIDPSSNKNVFLPSDTAASAFQHDVHVLLTCPAAQFAELRDKVVEQLQAASPTDTIHRFLELCVQARSEDGLDVGINVLSQLGGRALQCAKEFKQADESRWASGLEIRYHPNDDVWYMLLRAAAHAGSKDKELFALMRDCSRAGNRGIRDAVVEALSDCDRSESRELLEMMSTDERDEFIQRLAKDTLDALDGKESQRP